MLGRGQRRWSQMNKKSSVIWPIAILVLLTIPKNHRPGIYLWVVTDTTTHSTPLQKRKQSAFTFCESGSGCWDTTGIWHIQNLSNIRLTVDSDDMRLYDSAVYQLEVIKCTELQLHTGDPYFFKLCSYILHDILQKK